MSHYRVLVAGVGNIFLGDDAFGVEVVRELMQRPLPEDVKVVDFGIRGLDLTYALLDGYETVVLVDAMPCGDDPGTLHVVEPGPEESGPSDLTVEGHNLDPVRVLRLAASMGSQVQRLLIVGCEPSPVEDVEEMTDGLSPPVRAAVDTAVRLIEKIVTNWEVLAVPTDETAQLLTAHG